MLLKLPTPSYQNRRVSSIEFIDLPSLSYLFHLIHFLKVELFASISSTGEVFLEDPFSYKLCRLKTIEVFRYGYFTCREASGVERRLSSESTEVFYPLYVESIYCDLEKGPGWIFLNHGAKGKGTSMFKVRGEMPSEMQLNLWSLQAIPKLQPTIDKVLEQAEIEFAIPF